MSLLPLTLACWDYDRTRGLADGSVPVVGVDLNYLPLRVEETFWRMLRHQEFDAAEMSLGAYLRACDAGEPRLVAIPVFPSRAFRHSCIYVNADAGIERAEDLRGRRVGVPEYDMTMAIWVRGMLQHDHGVDPRGVTWFTGGQEQPAREDKLPREVPGVDIRRIGPRQTLSAMLEAGELDALVCAHLPSPMVRGSPKVRRLFADYREREVDWFRRTGVFPPMHTVVLREDVYRRSRWVARNLADAFETARQRCRDALYDFSALKVMLAWAIDEIEHERSLLGPDPWAYGLEANRAALEMLVGFAAEQGITSRRLDVAELFAPETLDSFRI